MTVSELIKQLNQLSPDAVVHVPACRPYDVLRPLDQVIGGDQVILAPVQEAWGGDD